MKGPACRQAGFTLLEVVITTAVAAIIGGLLIAILVQNTGLFYRQSSRVQEGIGLNDALSAVKNSIRQAQSVANTASGEKLDLKVASIDASGNIIDNIFDFFLFSKSGDKLYLKIVPDSQSSRRSENKILTGLVDSVLFQYFDGLGMQVTPTSAVKVKLTILLKQQRGTTFEANIATAEANLRND